MTSVTTILANTTSLALPVEREIQEKAPVSDISMRLDRIPFSRLHKRLLVAGGCGYMFDGLDISVIAFVLPALKLEWGLSSAEIGLLAAASQAGGLIGAALAGWLGDRFGRRQVMMWALGLFSIASLGCAFAPGWYWFLVLRTLTGFGTSAETAIVSPYLAEFAGPSFRGRFLGSLMGFFSFGFLLAGLLAISIIPLHADGWRIALIITGLPVFVLLWWRRVLPESPRWLQGRGRTAEAEAIVERIERDYEAKHGPLPIPEQPSASLAHAASPSSSADVPQRIQWRSHAVMFANWFAMGFCYYAFITWIPSMLVERGMSMDRSFAFTMTMFAAQVPGYFTAAWLNDIIGRRMVIASYMLLAALFACGVAFAQSDMTMLACAVALSFFMNGAYAGLYPYTAEIYPTAIRARALGSLLAISRLAAVASPIAVGFAYPAFGFFGVFAPCAVLLLIAGAAVQLFGPHTRGVSLEDVAHH